MTWTAVGWIAVAAIVTVEFLCCLVRRDQDIGRPALREPDHANRRDGTGPEAHVGRPSQSPISETSGVDVDQLMHILADQGAAQLKRERERA